MLKKAKEYKDVFFDLANDIYIPDDDYDLYGVEIKPKLVELEDDGQNEHDQEASYIPQFRANYIYLDYHIKCSIR